MPSFGNMYGGLAYKCVHFSVRFHSSHSILLVLFSNRVLRRVFHHHKYTFQVYIITQSDTLSSHPLDIRSKPLLYINTLYTTSLEMCFTEPSHSSRHGKRYYKEEREVVAAPRPVRVHNHYSSGHRHNHSGTPVRNSYTEVTRTVRPVGSNRAAYVPSPRQSSSSYRRSGPVLVEQRRSTQYLR